MTAFEQPADGDLIAVVGLAGRFPGTADVDRFWQHLLDGDELITRFPAEPGRPVPAYGVFAESDRFDAAFFGYSPREALMLDPQHRVFLECAWEALERSAHDPARFPGRIGVYAGCGEPTHLQRLYADPELSAAVPGWELRLATAVDFLTSRVSYKLGLTGPAVTVQTACSTSLVAVHQAGQALLAGECDLALAGGVTVQVPHPVPVPTEGGILSMDGHCRPFDARADGTVGADGAGVVVLRRLEDALADGDHVHAVILATAVNNDGNDKIGFTAPSVSGQAAAVRAAHLVAGIDPATIGYLEAHGTATAMGDPIEVEALTQAFRAGTAEKEFCRLGSVKGAIGHPDTAAGVIGLIKAALAVEHGLIPPNAQFTEPNPQLDLSRTPFTVNTELERWSEGPGPRRAGVNSVGLGGTNAHAVLQQPPARPTAEGGRGAELLVLSARTGAALEQAGTRLAAHLTDRPEVQLADVAWTLQEGRGEFAQRAFVVAGDPAAAAARLREGPRTGVAGARPPAVGFLFPGQGGQYPGMAAELYEREPVFRAEVDACAELLAPALGLDLREVLYPTTGDGQRLHRMELAQPAVFTVEYALAQLWRSWGVEPRTVLGHSLGAYAAACVAGVLTLPDALAVVVERGRLLGSLRPGAMLAVGLPEAELRTRLPESLSVAAVNGPDQVVLAGPAEAVAELAEQLTADGVDNRKLHISSAAHSALVEPAVEGFRAFMAGIELRAPELRWISDTTGRPVTAQEATDPAFWARHLRHTVRFGEALDTLLDDETDQVLIEAGPGRTLGTLARRHPAAGARHTVLSCLPHPNDETPARTELLTAVGGAWAAGVRIDWTALAGGRPGRRLILPSYPFQHASYRLGATQEAREEAERPELEQEFEATANPDEARLAELFGQVLGVRGLGRTDDFFDLGGDSLIASRLLALVREAFGVGLSVRAVFKARTVAGLLPLIEEAAAAGGAEEEQVTER
ncbi:type I polyketide synthase [Kitasatospora viridis]|uniref:Acyl transferase domain-containing protein n=1 Tax=Kitasatospora viridis TaxID=281105 RepID=A0A561T6H8_9ACTN|nr:type I polyketide synthase [Kitasatospora viridis]TWF82699.1 acyl transferase domain-containing protein [Kitasatospora viridis]